MLEQGQSRSLDLQPNASQVKLRPNVREQPPVSSSKDQLTIYATTS